MNIGKLSREHIFSKVEELKLDKEFQSSAKGALKNAIANFDFEYVNILLEIGVEIAPESIGCLAYVYGQETRLHGEQALQMAELLLRHGASPDALSEEYRFPLDICGTFSSTKFEVLLRSYGATKREDA